MKSTLVHISSDDWYCISRLTTLEKLFLFTWRQELIPAYLCISMLVSIYIFPFWLVHGLFALVPTEYNKVAVVPFLGQNQHVYM